MTTAKEFYIETDFFMDVDDAGALAIAFGAHALGSIRLLGVGVNTPSIWGGRAVKRLASAYKIDVPVGTLARKSVEVAPVDYAQLIGSTYEGADPTEPAWALLRRILVDASPNSVRVVSLGFFENLVATLDSPPDTLSPLSGEDLVRLKVESTYVMGGLYPRGREFNFVEDVEMTKGFLARWPGELRFLGQEVGNDVVTGARLSREVRPEHPLRMSYEAYNGPGRGRPSWDPMTVVAAMYEDWRAISWSAPGEVVIESPDGTCSWSERVGGRHRVAHLAQPADQIAAGIDDILMSTIT